MVRLQKHAQTHKASLKRTLFVLVLTLILAVGTLSPMVLAAPIGTTPGNPISVTMGKNYSWSWTKNSDHLYCYNQFTVTETGMLHFRIDKINDSEGEMCKYDIDLYRGDDIVAAFRCTYSVDLPKQYYDFYVGLKPGTYYLNLKPGFRVISGTFTANYSFSFEPMNCEQEPNESKAQANQLIANQWMEAYYGNDGAAYTASQMDWFKYDMVAGNSYRIYIKNYEKITATTMIYNAYDPSGKRVFALSNENKSSVDDEGNTYWDYVAEKSGTYYFKFYNYMKAQINYGIMIYDPSHTHTWRADGQVSAPTCTEAGVTRYVCNGCGAVKTETTPALGHDFVTTSVVKEATYYEEGIVEQTCSRCSYQTTATTPVKVLFEDVANTKVYYFEPVRWAVENGITTGTTATTFSPDDGCTRAQVVTFLWRAAGKPEPTGSANPFADVKSGQYDYNAVLWAVEKGITNGTAATKFSPDDTCTRAQIVTFLWRFAGKPTPASQNNPFGDVRTSEYYGNAVLWAVENGITNGTSATTFDPEATCTRAQVVTFLYRDMKK